MDPKTLTHKALDRSDDVGAFIAAVVGICGILRLPERWNITSNDLAMLLGFGFTIIAFARGRLESAYRIYLQGGRFSDAQSSDAAPASSDTEADEETEVPSPVEESSSAPSNSPTLPPPPKVP